MELPDAVERLQAIVFRSDGRDKRLGRGGLLAYSSFRLLGQFHVKFLGLRGKIAWNALCRSGSEANLLTEAEDRIRLTHQARCHSRRCQGLDGFLSRDLSRRQVAERTYDIAKAPPHFVGIITETKKGAPPLFHFLGKVEEPAK